MSDANDNPGLLASAADEEGANQPITEGQEQTTISHVQSDTTDLDDAPLERPDFWPEKFWNKDNQEPDLEGISKSYVELEKKFRAGGHKPPENGEYDIGTLGLKADDPVVKSYVGWAQKYGISQTAFEELAREVTGIGATNMQQARQSMADELEALGPNAKSIINNMAQWGRGMVQKGIWSEDEFFEFTRWGDTAKGIKALQKLRATYEGKVPTDTLKPDPEGSLSREELDAMVANPEYKTNPSYRLKVEKLFEKMFP
jgi:hypothetical protein